VGDAAASEGDAGPVTVPVAVQLSCATSDEVTVDVATADGTATAGFDYQELAPTQVTIPPGTIVGTVELEVLGDAAEEADETFDVVLLAASGAVVGDATGTVTILDDDEASAACPAPETIDYGGFSAADCAVPQQSVSVFNQPNSTPTWWTSASTARSS
jgi:Calx-beta domain